VGVVFSQVDDSNRICLDGVIDIACAGDLKAALLQAIEEGKEIRLSVSQATDMDVTAFQLLWAAKRTAKAKGVKISFADDLSPSIRASFENAGLIDLSNHQMGS
jgi:anti-anti-sigma regulatory factor